MGSHSRTMEQGEQNVEFQEALEQPQEMEEGIEEGVEVQEDVDDMEEEPGEEEGMVLLQMEGFATGFSVPGKTKPGFGMESDEFKIVFTGVTVDGGKNLVTKGLETCYDWRDCMGIVLTAAKDYEDLADIEDKTEEVLRRWLKSFRGWGLLSCMVAVEKHRHFLMALLYTWANWQEATGGVRTEQKVFNTVKYVYEHIQGKNIGSMVPEFGVWFEELDSRTEEGERRKSLTFFFKAQWDLEVGFIVEKKRVNDSLVDLAAEAVAKHLEDVEDVTKLEIPKTLFEPMFVKFKDAEWIRGHMRHINNTRTIADISDDIIDENEQVGNIDQGEDYSEIEEEEEMEGFVQEQEPEETYTAASIDEVSSFNDDKTKDSLDETDSGQEGAWWI